MFSGEKVGHWVSIHLAAVSVSKLHIRCLHAAQRTNIQLLINPNYELLLKNGTQQGDLSIMLMAVISKNKQWPSVVFAEHAAVWKVCQAPGPARSQDLLPNPKLSTSTIKQLQLIGTSLAHRGALGYVCSSKINIVRNGTQTKEVRITCSTLPMLYHLYHSLQIAHPPPPGPPNLAIN